MEANRPTRSTRIARIDRALTREGRSERPVAVLDLDAFDANLEDLAPVRRPARGG